jgi:hypothetical protein
MAGDSVQVEAQNLQVKILPEPYEYIQDPVAMGVGITRCMAGMLYPIGYGLALGGDKPLFHRRKAPEWGM